MQSGWGADEDGQGEIDARIEKEREEGEDEEVGNTHCMNVSDHGRFPANLFSEARGVSDEELLLFRRQLVTLTNFL